MVEAVVLNVGESAAHALDFQYDETTKRPFDAVLASLAREIDHAGMKILHQIDPRQALAGIGYEIRGLRLLFFFHPTLVVRVMRANAAAMVEAPLKLVVAETADGTVTLRMADPAMAFARYGDADLTQLGKELSATCRGIVDASI